MNSKPNVILRQVSLAALIAAGAHGNAYAKTVPAQVLANQASATSQNDQAASDQSGAALSEIIVTATRRSENLQRVGISVTAFSSEQIQQLGFRNAVDLVRQTPGLSINSSSPSNTNVNIRGVSQNDFADHLEGPIAVYSDDGYLGNAGAVNVQTYDLERVEILRGPQGTLFGRNATGGLIHFISRPPTDQFEAFGQVDVGERDLIQFEGAVSGPLSDHVRARLSFAGTHDDGYVKNLIGADPGNRNNYSGRLQIVADLSDVTQLKLQVNGNTNSGEHGTAAQGIATVPNALGLGTALGNAIGSWPNIVTGGIVTGTCAGCDILGYKGSSDIYKVSLSDPGTFERDIVHGQAKLTSELFGANLTTVSDYLYVRKNNLKTDSDGGPSQFFRYSTREKYHQFSQEVRLDGAVGRLKWLFGGYYLSIRGDYETSVLFDVSRYVGAPVCGVTSGFPCPTPIPGVIVSTDATYSIDVDSYAAYAQLNYELTSQLSVVGGVRYSRDDKTVDYIWSSNFYPPVAYNRSTDPTADRSFKNLSIRTEIDWHPTRDTLVYASFNRGWKGGNWAMPVFPPPITTVDFAVFPHKQERLDAYEVGLKTELWDSKIRFNIDAFYYDYHNYQAFTITGLNQSIFNKDAKAWGGEAELTVAPMRGLQFNLGAASITSRVYDMQSPTGVFYTARLPLAPKLSLNGLVRYEWAALGGKLAAQANFNTVGGAYFSVANEPITWQKRYFNGDLRLTYTAPGNHWNVGVWVRNVTDAKYKQFALDLSTLSIGGQVYAPPRWIGATFGFKL